MKTEDAAALAAQASDRATAAEAAARTAAERRQAAEAATATARQEADTARQEATTAKETAASVQAEAEQIRKRAEAEVGRLEEALGQVAETRRTALGLVMNLGGDHLKFEFDKAELRPQDKELLSRIAGILLTSHDYTISVNGHTDDVGLGRLQPAALRAARAGRARLPREGGPAGGHPQRRGPREGPAPGAGKLRQGPRPEPAGGAGHREHADPLRAVSPGPAGVPLAVDH